MSIFLGNSEIGNQYIDAYQLGRIYLGVNLVQGEETDIPIGGLVSWWDAGANFVNITGSNTVVSWIDKSGNNNIATGYTAVQPPITQIYYSASKSELNNKPTVKFDAGYLTYPNTLFVASGSITTFIVGMSQEAANTNTPVFIGEGYVTPVTSYTSSNYGVTLRPHQPGTGGGSTPLNPTIGNTGNNSGNLGTLQRMPSNVSSSMSTYTFYTWGWRVNNLNQFGISGSFLTSSLSVNNNIVNFPPNPTNNETYNLPVGGITATTDSGRRIGADLYHTLNAFQYYYGEIAEIIVYNRYLSDNEYNRVLLYLKNKYGHY